MDRIAFVLGTRPEILKLKSVIDAVPKDQRVIIWTGQHWSKSLSDDVMSACGFVPDMLIPPIMCEPPFLRLAEMVIAIGPRLQSMPLKWLVVQGDTDSALAGALTAIRLGVPVYHVEAGSRSWDRSQPEETNRVLIDDIASASAHAYDVDGRNLLAEGVEKFRQSIFSGDTLIDDLKVWEAQNPQNPLLYGGRPLATIHRAETLNDPDRLHAILDFLSDMGGAVMFTHPHLRQVVGDDEITHIRRWNILWRDPVSPSEFREILRGASRDNSKHVFITDSGGAATEAAYFGVPTVIARDHLELHDLADCGRIVLGGRTRESLAEALQKATRDAPLSEKVKSAWHGEAGKRIAERLLA